jgi:hypothetical protein
LDLDFQDKVSRQLEQLQWTCLLEYLASCKKPAIDVRLFSPVRGVQIHFAPVAQLDRATDF